MIDTDFIELTESTLHFIAEKLEPQLPDEEIDVREGFLQIILVTGQIWLINRHSPTQELWLSSPVSGGYHFQYHPSKAKWIATRSTQDELFEVLSHELSTHSQPPCKISLVS